MSNYSHATLELEAKNTSWTKIFGYVPERSTVLDVGCSDGVLGAELKKRKSCKVYGIELDAGDAAAARKVLDGVFSCNVETDELPPELAALRFDAIILADVIEHLVHPASALKTLQRLLKKGGRIIFSVPNMGHVSVRLQLLGGSFKYGETGLLDNTHLHFYTFDELKRVLNVAGLKITDIDANTLEYPPSFLRDKLAELGLSDAGFIERMKKDREAQSFQFVGYCLPRGAKEPASDTQLATTTPEHELTEYIEALRQSADGLAEAHAADIKSIAKLTTELKKQYAETAKLHAQIAAHQAELAAQHAQIATLQARVEEVTSSPLWRAGDRAARFANKWQKRENV